MRLLRILSFVCLPALTAALQTAYAAPLGEPGASATYRIVTDAPAASTAREITLILGDRIALEGSEAQWLQLSGTVRNAETFHVWVLCDGYPPATLDEAQSRVMRYILQQGNNEAVEYRHAVTGRAILPTSGAWTYLFPRPVTEAPAGTPFAASVDYLGHRYTQSPDAAPAAFALPETPKVHLLRPDVLTGVPHNARQVDETRRYDESEYEYISLTRTDFEAMAAAGLNCFIADREHNAWFEEIGVFYWGGGVDLRYPECLYNPLYLGMALYLDEPAVVTRDYVIRPRLKDDPEFRKSFTPQVALEAFEEHYAKVIAEGAPVQFMKALAGREDVDLGTMLFQQPNLYSWETMVSAAAHELSYDPVAPGAIVFEPPGQLGNRRTVPAWNMSYGCQIPVAGRDHFIDIIIAFLRGAARATDKEWGISIYGGVDRIEAGSFISRAYELGATRFFYWDSAQLACVPFGEVLDHTRHLTAQAKEYPHRDLDRLLHAAEVAILFPPGYNLGHVHMGKGMLWGLPELNLERLNQAGIPYRTVMGNLFTEIERCIRQGVAFDLLWDLPKLQIEGYREIVRIREDGKVDVDTGNSTRTLDGPRVPERSGGAAPQLTLTIPEGAFTAPCTIDLTAAIVEGDAPVYYAPKPDATGVHHNNQVLWELYGPSDEEYTYRGPEIESQPALALDPGHYEARATLHLTQPGRYRLRAATTDLAGRSAVVWKDLEIK